MKKKVAILRSAIGSLSSVSLLKFFKNEGFSIIGVDIVDNAVGKFFVDKFYKVPKASVNDEEVIDRFLYICKKENVKWIISGPEEEIIKLAKYESLFTQNGTKLFHPKHKVLNIITDKWKLYLFLKDKFIMPRTFTCIKEIKNDNMNTHIIIKPRKGRGGTGIKISKKSNLNEKDLNNDYIIQEFIEGKEYTVDVLCDMNGRALNIIPRVRLKVDSGITVVGKTENNNSLINIIQELLKFIKLRGMNCIQFIYSFKDKQYYLTDINPRFGGGSILSIKSSKSLRKNIRYLLQDETHKLSYKNEFDEIKMYRYYAEIYEN